MLSQELSVQYNKYSKRLSLAYELKKDLDTFLLKKFNISAFTENSEEKKFIRPLLICYGTSLMRKKDPDCWINKLQKTIDDLNIKLSKHIKFIDSTYEGLKNPIEAARKWLRK